MNDSTLPKSRRRQAYLGLAALLIAGPTVTGTLSACKKVDTDTNAPDGDGTAATGDSGPSEEELERQRRAKEAAEKKAMLEALPALPGIEKPKPVVFPDPVITTLDNGLEVIVLEDHESPLVEVSLEIKAGDIYAPNDKPTLASMTASLMREGSEKRKKAVIDEQIDMTGGGMGAFASNELASLNASMPSGDLDLALKLIAEQALSPAFPAEAIDKLKDETKQGTKAAKGQPQTLVAAMSAKVMYGDGSAYGRGFPTEKEIDAVTREDIVAFHERHYLPNNAMIVIAGDVDPKKAQKIVKKHLGKWAKGEQVAVPKSEAAPPDKPIVHIIGRRMSAQSTIAVLVPAPVIGEEGWLEAKVIEKILSGGTLSTRLNSVLREQLGLTYGAYAFHDYGYDGGVLAAAGGTKRKTGGEFTEALIELVFGIADEAIEKNDLDRTKAFVSGRFALEAEGVDVAASRTVTSRLYGLPDDFWSSYRSDVAAITPAKLDSFADQLFDRNRMQIVAVGKTKDLKEQLGKFGEIRVYDKDLNRVE